MTNPSHLKVRYLKELPELPPEEIENSWTYSYVPDGPDKDYKVSVAGIAEVAAEEAVEEAVAAAEAAVEVAIEAAVEEAVEEAVNIVKDDLSGSDGASLIGYGDTTVEAALDAIPEPPTNYVTTNSAQTGLAGNKTWTGVHQFWGAIVKGGSFVVANDANGHLWFRKGDIDTARGVVYVTGSGASQTMNVRVYDDSTGLYKTLSLGADGTITWDGYEVYHEGNIPPWDPGDPGDAVVADRLAIPRNINGTSFDGTKNITTANWGTARTLTIGSTGKSVNGSGNVTWSLSEIGAAPASHTHTIANITGLQTELNGRMLWLDQVNDGAYDDHVDKVSAAAFYHSQGYAPSDSPISSQASVLHLGNLWGRAQLVFPNSGTNRVFVRTGTSTDWSEVYTTSNFNPATKADVSHTHTIANVTGLQSALDGKAASSHTHTISQVSGLQSALDGKAASSHTHSASQITSGKLDVARLPHVTGNESTGWVRLNSNSASPDTMGSIRLTTGGTSFVYTFDGVTRFSCSSAGNMSVTGAISDTDGPVRRAKHRVANGSGNFNAALDLNGIVEKTNTSAATYTIPASFGEPGDIITVINSGSSGNITIARASGVSLYSNGTNANITVTPGSMVTIVRTATANRWQA